MLETLLLMFLLFCYGHGGEVSHDNWSILLVKKRFKRISGGFGVSIRFRLDALRPMHNLCNCDVFGHSEESPNAW